jgi:hypothetical protein
MSAPCIIRLEAHLPELTQPNNHLEAIKGGIVTLKKGVKPENRAYSLNEISAFYPEVGSDVFIIGYPKGITYSEIFPIWKRASIASEPLVGVHTELYSSSDLFYTDGLTKHGMSGSPVIRKPNIGDVCFTDDGDAVDIRNQEPILLGVYAGRDGVTQEEYEFSLGRVWKIQVIEELFRRSLKK